jgi:hypothetical protein
MPHHYHRLPSRRNRSEPTHYGYDEHENHNEDTKDYGGKDPNQRSVTGRQANNAKGLHHSKKRHS